jgi:hypothetical protein
VGAGDRARPRLFRPRSRDAPGRKKYTTIRNTHPQGSSDFVASRSVRLLPAGAVSGRTAPAFTVHALPISWRRAAIRGERTLLILLANRPRSIHRAGAAADAADFATADFHYSTPVTERSFSAGVALVSSIEALRGRKCVSNAPAIIAAAITSRPASRRPVVSLARPRM